MTARFYPELSEIAAAKPRLEFRGTGLEQKFPGRGGDNPMKTRAVAANNNGGYSAARRGAKRLAPLPPNWGQMAPAGSELPHFY